MNIPELILDNLTWNDLVDTGRRAIPAASEGQWTLHAPVDPGITLMELFAAQLEQRLFILDRVPDALVRAVMRLLLGPASAPRPAAAAITVLSLCSTVPAQLAAGSEFSQVFDGRRVVLTTEHAAVVVPGARLTGLEVAGVDRLAQLRGGEPVAILGVDGRSTAELIVTADAGASEHRLHVGTYEPPRAGWPVGSPVPAPADPTAGAATGGLGWIADGGRRVFLDGDGREVPDDDLGALAAASPLRWELVVGAGTWPVVAEDATGGLRVPGVVRLRPAPPRTFPPAFRLRVSATGTGEPYRPWLAALALNAVVARQRCRVGGERISVADPLPVPRREIVLSGAAPDTNQALDRVIDDPDLVRLTARLPDGAVETWTAVDDLSFSAPGDRHVEVYRAGGRLRFGDGRAGRIPRWPPQSELEVDYWVGGGEPPQIGLGQDFEGPQLTGMPGTAVTGTTVTGLRWGHETETMERARARAAEELSRSTRAVTASDVEAIVRAVPGVRVGAVRTSPGSDPAHPGVTVPDAISVFCVPAVYRRSLEDLRAVPGPDLDPVSREAVARALERARLVGSRIVVRGPAYRPVRVTVELAIRSRDPAAVRRRAELVVRQYLDPLVGGADGEGWPFGAPLAPWDLNAVLQRIVGRQADVTRVVVAVDGAAASDCAAVAVGPDELPRLADVAIVAAPVEGVR